MFTTAGIFIQCSVPGYSYIFANRQCRSSLQTQIVRFMHSVLLLIYNCSPMITCYDVLLTTSRVMWIRCSCNGEWAPPRAPTSGLEITLPSLHVFAVALELSIFIQHHHRDGGFPLDVAFTWWGISSMSPRASSKGESLYIRYGSDMRI